MFKVTVSVGLLALVLSLLEPRTAWKYHDVSPLFFITVIVVIYYYNNYYRDIFGNYHDHCRYANFTFGYRGMTTFVAQKCCTRASWWLDQTVTG